MIYVALGFAALCIIALVVVMRWGMKAKDETHAAMDIVSATRELLGEKHIECERLAFELKTTAAALTASTRLGEALTKELADAIERSSLGAGLPANDVLGRLQRIAQARQAGSGDPVPAVADEAVHHTPTSERPGDALLPFDEDANV